MSDAGLIAKLITEDFYQEQLDLSARKNAPPSNTWSAMPEVECVGYLRDCGVSERMIRLYITFIAAMDYSRDSKQLWWAGVELFVEHPDLFDPIKLSQGSFEMLSEKLKEKKVSQRHTRDSDAWCDIACTLLTEPQFPVNQTIESGIGDAKKLLNDVTSLGTTGRVRFPLLRGPKISTMWIRMLAEPGRAKIRHIETIPVAVDTHVCRATSYLGVTNKQSLTPEKDRKLIQSVWHSAVATTNIGGPERISGSCAALDPALWFYGKHGCSQCQTVGYKVRIGRACTYCQI